MCRASLQLLPTILILLVSLSVAIAVTWLVPSLNAASVNMLFRFRGQLPAPDDIVIVAIDDASLQQVGNWPWPRTVMASALDRITDAHPRAVGLDVIYAEPSEPEADQRLAAAIRHNGRVVLPAQLTEFETTQSDLTGPSTWLLPLTEIKDAAASIGHAHAAPDVDGVLRTIQLSKADEKGERLWAFGLETLRVAEEIPPGKIEERAGALRVGPHEIAIQDEAQKSSLPGVSIIRSNEMMINYIGPPKTFTYYSIADILREKIPPAAFANKIVLIGAVAQTMGDMRVTPFISYGGAEHQSRTGMPGVEVHANVIETIRRGSWFNPRPDLFGFSVTLLVILAAAFIVRLLDGWRVLASLAALLALVIAGSLYVFNHHFLIPPLVPVLAGFFTVVPLLLINSSITASRDLDRKLDQLAHIQQRFMSHNSRADLFTLPLSFLASILRAETVALFQTSQGRAIELTACYGQPPAENEKLIAGSTVEVVRKPAAQTLRIPLMDETATLGLLHIEHVGGEPFTESERRLAHAFADGLVAQLRTAERSSELMRETSFPISLPHNIIWKLRAVDDITAHLIARIGFMNQVFTSMTEGLLVADITGQVVFANPAAPRLWEESEAAVLTGQSLNELFAERGIVGADSLCDAMRRALTGQSAIIEVEQLTREGRFYTLQFSAVLAGESMNGETPPQSSEALTRVAESPRAIGMIVIITDITKRRELERVKAETLQLVSHELRTPLTSIRGLSDLLLKYPVPEGESKELLETIYSEAVRMNELINRYLDVTRIESGAQTLARRPVEANHLIKESVRTLSPQAADKEIKLKVNLSEPSPTLYGDEPLLTQAINNLLSNAIKYSSAASSIEIGTMKNGAEQLCIYVRDEGYGIPQVAQARVFEKFYRLERDVKSETVGTALGLALVKEIVERHGGLITLESEPDKGSTFTICLPFQKA